MKNLTVAVLLSDFILKANYDSFKLFESFGEKFNISTSYEVWEGCSSNVPVDAYMLDPNDFVGCAGEVHLPLVVEPQAMAVMIPIKPKKNRYRNLLMPIDVSTQICSTLALICFGIVSSLAKKLYLGNFDLIRGVLTGFKVVVGQSVLQEKNHILRLLCIFMSIFGIFNTNMYTANMSKLLVKPEDENSYEVLCTASGIEFLKNFEAGSDFIMSSIEDYELFSMIGSLNLEFGYCVKTSDWNQRLHFQRDLKKNMFKLATPWIESFKDHTVALINTKSEYAAALKTFILDAYSTGLVDKWQRDMSIKNFSTKYIEIGSLSQIVLFDDLRMLFVYFGFGAVAGVVSFLLEIVVRRLSLRVWK